MISSDQGLPECQSPKACLRQAFTQNWISEEETWLEMLDVRNRMSHTYNAKKALEIYEHLPRFYEVLCDLFQNLKKG